MSVRYTLDIPTAELTLNIVTLKTLRHTLNQPYFYRLSVIADHSIALDSLAGQSALLSVIQHDEQEQWPGYIEQAHVTTHDGRTWEYDIEFAHPLAQLLHQQSAHVWIDKNLSDITNDLLKPLTTISTEWHTSVPSYPNQLLLHEPNLQYLHRVWAEANLHYMLVPNESASQLILADSIARLSNQIKPTVLTYTEISGAPLPPKSTWRIEARHTEEGLSYFATTNAVGLIPGQLISVEGHPSSSLNQSYHVVERQLEIEPNETTYYVAQLTLIPLDASYACPRYPRPLFNNTLLARIDGEPDALAPVDENGCYRLRWAFDREGKLAGQGTSPVPVLQSFHGKNAGIAHSMSTGTAVSVGFIKSDPTQPLILGAAPTAASPSLTEVSTALRYTIQSHQGHGVILSDHPREPAIKLYAADEASRIQLGADQTSDIDLYSRGNLTYQATNTIKRQAGKQHQQAIGQSMVLNTQSVHTVAVQQGDYAIQVGGGWQDNATDTLNMAAKNGFYTHTDGHLTTTAEQGVTLLSTSGKVHAQGADVVMHTEGALTAKAAQSSTLQVGAHTMQSTSNGDLIIAAKNITLSASDSIHLATPTSGYNQGGAANVSEDQFDSTLGHTTTQNTPLFQAKTTPSSMPLPTQSSAVAASQSDNSSSNSSASSSENNEQTPPLYPSLSFDLSLLPAMEGTIVFEGKPFLYKTTLSGTVNLQKQGQEPSLNFSINDYKLEARSTLSHFFADLSLHPNSHEQMVLGSEATGEFVSTSVITNFTNKIHFESSPQPLEKTFLTWKAEGNLAFMIDLISQNPPPFLLSDNENTAWLKQEWYNISNIALTAGIIVLGAKLAPILEDVALSSFLIIMI